MPNPRLSIRHQLLVLGAVVTASVWTGALLQYVQLRSQAVQLTEVRLNLTAAAHLDAAASRAASERGRSNGWLLSKGQADFTEVSAARAELDRALQPPPASAAVPPAIDPHVKGLATLRDRIDRHEVVASESFALYTALIAAVHDTAARHRADGMVLVGLHYEHVNHLQHAAELLAQMRGLVNGALRAHALDESVFEELARAHALYEEVLRLYDRAVPEAVRSAHPDAVHAPATLAAVERLRTLVNTRDVDGFGMDPKAWWSLATRATDALSTAAAEQAATLSQEASERIAVLERQLTYTVVALVMLGLVTLILVVSTVGRIVRGLDRLLLGLDSVGRQRNFNERIADSGHDEFGTISEGINKLIAIAGSVVHEQEALSLTDALTGAMNRRGFDQQLEARTMHARTHSVPLCVVMIDIDHFKAVNDTHGHAAGDQVLRQLGALLRAELRADDVLARFGGEEFVALLPGCAPQAALGVAEKLRAAIEAHDFQIGRRVTASFGVSAWSGERSAQALIEEADANLYTSKRDGRNRVTWKAPPAISQPLAA